MAFPMGSGEEAERYLVSDQYLNRWAIGAYYLDRTRDINTLNRQATMMSTKFMGYIGYEFRYGIYAYLTVGTTDTRFQYLNISDQRAEYGAGLQFNILNHEIPDPTLMEDRITVNANIQYTQFAADWFLNEIEIDEVYGTLTMSIINDIEGNKYFNLNSIGFFFGAAYSHIISSSIDEKTSMGFTAGIDLYLTEKVSFEIGTESIDEGSVFGGIHICL